MAVLELNDCSINAAGSHILFESLQQSSLRKLQKIVMDNNPIEDDGMQFILQKLLSAYNNTPHHNHSLICLSFSNCNFGFIPHTWSLWANVMMKTCQHLKRINVSHNFIHPNSIDDIVRSMQKNHCLESLNVSNCRLNYWNSLQFIQGTSLHLSSLDISGCDMKHPYFDDYEKNNLDLKVHKSNIKQLYFGNNSKLFTDCKYFGHFIEWISLHCLRLEVLDLSRCGLTDDHVEILAGFVMKMPRLKCLNLSFNKLDDKCAMILCKMIQRQTDMLHVAWMESVSNAITELFGIHHDNFNFIQNIIHMVRIYCGIEEHQMMENLGLVNLDLRGNDITNIGANIFHKRLLYLNPVGQKTFHLDLAGNMLTNSISIR